MSEPQKVWVLSGERSIIGVFDSEELANQAAKTVSANDYSVDEFTINGEVVGMRDGLLYYQVQWPAADAIHHVAQLICREEFRSYVLADGAGCAYVWAANAQDAVERAGVVRAELIAKSTTA